MLLTSYTQSLGKSYQLPFRILRFRLVQTTRSPGYHGRLSPWSALCFMLLCSPSHTQQLGVTCSLAASSCRSSLKTLLVHVHSQGKDKNQGQFYDLESFTWSRHSSPTFLALFSILSPPSLWFNPPWTAIFLWIHQRWSDFRVSVPTFSLAWDVTPPDIHGLHPIIEPQDFTKFIFALTYSLHFWTISLPFFHNVVLLALFLGM